ncbi:MAG: ArgE/DapE family deacylase [Gaiellaceae bacterium]
MGHDLLQFEAVDEAIDGLSDGAFAFLERLVAAPSCVGDESKAQAVVAGELDRLGFDVSRLALAALDEPAAGIPVHPFEDRAVVVGRRSGSGRSLVINGHVDVVPPGAPELWSSPPFEPTRTADGWLQGRGSGDMKGGFAMAMLALEALLATCSEALVGPVTFVSAIEEECSGNGTLSSARAGVVGDAVLLPEPTDLGLLLGGIGILWVEITVQGRPVHAASAGEGVNAIDAALPLLGALRTLEAELRACPGGERSIVNVGTFRAGDWQSSVPAATRLGVRIGFPPSWTAAQALEFSSELLERETAADAWLAAHPPRIVPNGLRAEGYDIAPSAPAVALLAAAHREVVGTEPSIVPVTATTDARFYANQFGLPAVCYGPRARNIHGIDEAVELASIIEGARVLARFIVSWVGSS